MANTRKRKSKSDDPVSPDAKTRGRSVKVTLYILNNDKHMLFKNPAHADLYLKDNSDVIKTTHHFPSLKAYADFKKQAPATPQNTAVVKVEGLSPAEEQAALRINRRRVENAPTSAIACYWHTTAFSRACLVVFDVLDQNGRSQWYYKPRDFVDTLQAYSLDESVTLNGTHTQEIVKNFQTTERRDLEKSDNTIHKGKGGYTNYKAYSYFLLPVGNFSCEMEESEYIGSTLSFFGDEMKRVLSSPLYCSALRACTAAYSDRLEKHLFEPTKGLDWKSFIQHCNIVVRPFGTYTDHVIRDRIPLLRNVLALHDEPEPKYLLPDSDILQADNDSTGSSPGEDADDDPDTLTASRYAPGFNVDGGSAPDDPPDQQPTQE